jgi:hypothetical protein
MAKDKEGGEEALILETVSDQEADVRPSDHLFLPKKNSSLICSLSSLSDLMTGPQSRIAFSFAILHQQPASLIYRKKIKIQGRRHSLEERIKTPPTQGWSFKTLRNLESTGALSDDRSRSTISCTDAVVDAFPLREFKLSTFQVLSSRATSIETSPRNQKQLCSFL